MPTGASPEKESKKSDLYTYAVFSAALLNDVGVAMDNQRIALYDRRENFLAEWRPLHEDWTERQEIARLPAAINVQSATTQARDLHDPVQGAVAKYYWERGQ